MAALAMALLIFSVVISIYSASTSYQQMRYNQATETINNLREDFGRALIGVLAKFTQRYNETAEMESPRILAYYLFSYWTRSASRAFAADGVQLNFTLSNITLQYPGVFFGFNLTEARFTNNQLAKLFWYTPQSMSVVSASFDANLTGQGFYGWHEDALFLLNMTLDVPSIHQESINGTNYAVLNVYLNREYGQPVEDLSPSNFNIAYFDSVGKSWRNAIVSLLSNNGGGSYTLYLLNATGQAIPSPYYKYLLVWAQDTRGIIVESYTYTYVEYTIQENAIRNVLGPIPKPDETYALETLLNGSMLWFNTPLAQSGGFVPIPMPPVKQFRVYSTVNGPSDTNLVEIPSQVEVWTPDYLTPTLQFADWVRRFDVGDKLVFLVNFANSSINQQRVRIYWLFDADAPPPAYRVSINSSGIYVDINNTVYTARLVPNQGNSWAVDWTISMYYGSYHAEFLINGVGWVRMNGGGNWIPHILPGGDWNVLVGPIRAVAYRASADVMRVEPKPGGGANDLLQLVDSPGAFNHTDIVLIPYGTKYIQLYEDIIWRQTWTDHRYYSFLTMISGTSSDQGSAIRVTNWAHQRTDLSVHSGTYSSSPGTHDIDSNFMYWYGQYNNRGTLGFGEAVLPNLAYVNAIKGLFPGSSRLWIWTSADFARRVLDSLAYMYDGNINNWMTIPAGKRVSWTAGIWAYGGNGYGDLDTYYRMFVEAYYPTIVNITGGM
jgi:hypothetical protein